MLQFRRKCNFVDLNPAASPSGDGGPPAGSLSAMSRLIPQLLKLWIQQKKHFGSTEFGFTPHIITVFTGEDVASKIVSFTQNCPRAVCILSAIGVLSNVTLIQDDTSGGAATYEGLFDILTLSGSFLPSEIGGQRSRAGGLRVSLVGSDGQVFGGCVARVLTAASPLQVIVGSFVQDVRIPTTSHKQQIPGSTGFGFTRHIIAVKTGEDVTSKIVLFTQNSRKAVCILSASGAISNVTLTQITSRGTVTYEGLFDILALSGSFLPSEIAGEWTGGLSLLLTGSDGRAFGGYLPGGLTAASPVQVTVCCFSPPAASMSPNLSGMTGADSPPSRGTYGGLTSELGSHPKSKRSKRQR